MKRRSSETVWDMAGGEGAGIIEESYCGRRVREGRVK